MDKEKLGFVVQYHFLVGGSCLLHHITEEIVLHKTRTRNQNTFDNCEEYLVIRQSIERIIKNGSHLQN